MKRTITLEQLTQLSLEFEHSNQATDWEKFNVDKDSSYRMMAAHVADIVNSNKQEDVPLILAAAMTNLLVENFILNARLESQ